MLTHENIIERVLSGYDIPEHRQTMEADLSIQRPNNSVRSPRVKAHIRQVSANLGVPIRVSKNLPTLGAMEAERDEATVFIRPIGAFGDPRWFDLVTLHEFSHIIFAMLRQQPGVARWAASRTYTRSRILRLPPRKIIEELIVEISAIKSYEMIAGDVAATVFDPCYTYLRKQLGDLSQYGLSWKRYPETLAYCTGKAQPVSEALFRVAGLSTR